MGRQIVVTHDQVASAKALIELEGGADMVDPVIARIARARPARVRTATKAAGVRARRIASSKAEMVTHMTAGRSRRAG